MSEMQEITVAQLKARLDQGEQVFILDVREPHEYQICHLESAHLLPMSEIGMRFKELDPACEIIVQCRSGGRSAQVCGFLQKQGFANVKNLTGGILAWAREIDPSMPTY